MPYEQDLPKKHKYNFGTKGITIGDAKSIGVMLTRYEVEADYFAGNYRFETWEQLLDHVSNTDCETINVIGQTKQGGQFVNLMIAGPMSSWTVEKPTTISSMEWVISDRLFSEVKDILKRGSYIIPDPPWQFARGVFVLIPTILLIVQVAFEPPNLTNGDILRTTLLIASMHYMFSWRERRRWSMSAIARPNTALSVLKARWPDVAIGLFLVIATIIGDRAAIYFFS